MFSRGKAPVKVQPEIFDVFFFGELTMFILTDLDLLAFIFKI
jgi:hypothetical protein